MPDALRAQYSKFDALYDSDEEQTEMEAAKQKRLSPVAAARPQPKPDLSSMNPENMTSEQREQFAETYAKVMNRNRAPKEAYKFPETLEEQRPICESANTLRLRGNELYKAGEITEAAKLYEQAVHMFSDWYVEHIATPEERKLVHAVKLPAHLNLAACSHKLGNHQHCVVHCGQVLELQPDNAKALFRRGACRIVLGDLDDAAADLKRASSVAPADHGIRKQLELLKKRRAEYAAKTREMMRKGLSGAGAASVGSVRAQGRVAAANGRDEVGEDEEEDAGEEEGNAEADETKAGEKAEGDDGGSRRRVAGRQEQSWRVTTEAECEMAHDKVAALLEQLEAEREANASAASSGSAADNPWVWLAVVVGIAVVGIAATFSTAK
jgi:tetratricopeptide (TPR) repeat protein